MLCCVLFFKRFVSIFYITDFKPNSILLYQTFAKLQNFTSSLRKNKTADNGNNSDDNDNETNGKHGKSERVWKNSKVTAIDNLQSNETKLSDMKKMPKIEEFEAYNGQVLEEGSGDEKLGSDWHAGKLKFRKHITDKLRIGGDGRRVDDYVVLDSRSNRKINDD